jgi:hypothetical protein
VAWRRSYRVLDACVTRNHQAVLRSQAVRAQIVAMLEQHSPLARPLTAKDVRARLTTQPLPSLRAVQWHLQVIRGADSLRPAQFIT